MQQRRSFDWTPFLTSVARWPSGYGAGLAINRSRVRIPAAELPSATLGKLFTHMSITEQYNLVPANGR